MVDGEEDMKKLSFEFSYTTKHFVLRWPNISASENATWETRRTFQNMENKVFSPHQYNWVDILLATRSPPCKQ